MTLSVEFKEMLSAAAREAVRAEAAVSSLGEATEKAGEKAGFLGSQLKKMGNSTIAQARGMVLSYIGVGAAIALVTQQISKMAEARRAQAREETELARGITPGAFADPAGAIESIRTAAATGGIDETTALAAAVAASSGFSAGGGRGGLSAERANRAVSLVARRASAGYQDGDAFAREFGRLSALGVQSPEVAIAAAQLAGVDPGTLTAHSAARMVGQSPGAFATIISEGQRRVEMERRRQYDLGRGRGLFGDATPDWLRYANAEMLRSGQQVAEDEAEQRRRAEFDRAQRPAARVEVVNTSKPIGDGGAQ